jgi:hypothetical protein
MVWYSLEIVDSVASGQKQKRLKVTLGTATDRSTTAAGSFRRLFLNSVFILPCFGFYADYYLLLHYITM